jgi:hypothetical protein
MIRTGGALDRMKWRGTRMSDTPTGPHGDYDRTQSRVLWRIIVEGDRPRLV